MAFMLAAAKAQLNTAVRSHLTYSFFFQRTVDNSHHHQTTLLELGGVTDRLELQVILA